MSRDHLGLPSLLQHCATFIAMVGSHVAEQPQATAQQAAAARTAAYMLVSLTLDVGPYLGSTGIEQLAEQDLSPLVRGVFEGNAAVSQNCFAVLYNMRLTNGGTGKLLEYLPALLEGIQPIHHDDRVEMTMEIVLRGFEVNPHTALHVMRHIPAFVQALQQRNRSQKVHDATCNVVRELLRSPVGLLKVMQPAILSLLLPELVYQVQQQLASAAKCIESIAVAPAHWGAGKALLQYIGDLVAAVKRAPQQQQQQADNVGADKLVSSIVMTTMRVVLARPGGASVVAQNVDGILTVLQQLMPADEEAAFLAQYNRSAPSTAALSLVRELTQSEPCQAVLLSRHRVKKLLDTLLDIIGQQLLPRVSAAVLVPWIAQFPAGWEALSAPRRINKVLAALELPVGPTAPVQDADAATAKSVAGHMASALQAMAKSAARSGAAPSCLGQLVLAMQQNHKLCIPVMTCLGVLATYEAGQLQLAAHRKALSGILASLQRKQADTEGNVATEVPETSVQSIRDVLCAVHGTLAELVEQEAQSGLHVEQQAATVALQYVAYRRASTNASGRAAGDEVVKSVMLLQKACARHEKLQQQLTAASC